MEKKLVLEPKTKPTNEKNDDLPPVRSKSQLILNGDKKQAPVPSQPSVSKTQPAKPKSVKPRDYREWEK